MTRTATSPAPPVGDCHHDHDFNHLYDLEQYPLEEVPIEQRLLDLSPSARLCYDVIAPAIADSASAHRRLSVGGHVLVLARVPHSDWAGPAQHAVATVVEKGARGAVRMITAGPENPREIEFDRVISSITTKHLLVAVVGDLPAELAALADVVVDLAAITDDQIQSALDRAFPPDPTENPQILPLPAFYDLRDLRPEYLDGAVDRASSALEAVRLAELATSATRRRQEAREFEVAAKIAKPSTSSRGITATEILRPTSPTVGDLAGYGDAAIWAADLARDLSDYEAGNLGWEDVDAGCLLVGPPGTGKTMFASALAASASVAFVATSYSDWQSQREGHLGDVVRAIRKRFSDAAENAPAVLFIDEVDTMPARGTATNADDWWTAITTTLLECLDGTARREGVVVMAACNDASRLDPALIRSGRLDRRFEIGLPDETALARIVVHHLPDIDRSVAETVATVLAGTTTGADIARIARKARRVARRDRRTVSADDLLGVAMPECKLSPLDRRLVATHEAGHAVAALVLGFKVSSLSIVRHADALGGVGVALGETMARSDELERRIVGILCGRAAEEVILGEPSGGSDSDLAAAAKTVSQMIGRLGLGDRLTPTEPSTIEIEARLRPLYGRALRLVTERRAAIEALADLAVERRVLGRRAIAQFAIAHDLVPTGGAA